MRILHLVARSHRRGAEMAALELAHELDARGHQNHVLALGLGLDGGADPEFPPLARSTTVGPPAFVASVVRLRRLLRRERYDVVLADGGWTAEVAALAKPWGTRLVWQRILGFPPDFWHPLRRGWWRVLGGRMDAAVALTDDLGVELRRLGFSGPIWVIRNTRRPERFLTVDRTEAGAALRADLGLAPDVPLLGFVGHLVEQKRPERAIEVLSRVVAAGEPAHLVVAGDGPLRGRLEREIAARGMESCVHLLGHRNDVEQVLGAVDVLLLTSDSEGIPGVAIEAQMAGCPVITFPIGGVRAVVDDGHTGVVLSHVDTALMAEQAAHLLRRRDLREKMGDEGRRRSHDFDTSRTAEEYAEHFAELVHGAGDGGLDLYWYWPFLRAEDSGVAWCAVRPGDRLLVETLDRPGVPESGSGDQVVMVNDLPEVEAVPERSVRWIASRAATYVGRATARRRLMRRWPADVTHVMFTNRFTDPFDLALLRRKHRIVCTIHDAKPHQQRLPVPIEHWLMQRQLRSPHAIVVHNDRVKQYLVEHYGVAAEKVDVIPLHVPRFVADDEHRPPVEPPTVLYFGTFRRNKGIDVLLDAIERLPDLDCRFHFAGRGFAELEARVRDAAARDRRVTAEIGWITPERKTELHLDAALLVLPYTSFESESGVLRDAYGYRRPVVVTDVGALGESVLRDGTGWVAPPGDAAGLADALRAALSDRGARERAAAAGAAIAEARSPELVGTSLRALYDRVASSPPRRRPRR